MRTAAVCVPLLAILAATIWRAEGVAPQPTTAPADEFSSARAMDVLRSINDGRPRPIGSRASEAMREKVVVQFRALGYDTEVQTRFACDASAVCAEAHNIIARRPGASRRDAVLLVAHYDSVPAGPGASDNSTGVATLLEIARAIRNERFRNDIAFLIDDGEEAGLLGAEAFAADPALRREAGVVLNVETRGTHGASMMFETSRGNRWLIRQLAHALPTPQTSSLFYTIYDQLPNDTDVTVFKREGVAAMNFGAIRGVQWYHTPLDDVAHANARTIQHHGENLLASLRAFGNADLDARSDSDATWFDVLGFALVWWPQEWTLWIAAGSLILLTFGSRGTDPRAMTFGVLATFATLIITIPAAIAVSRLARLRSMDINFVADPRASIVAMWLVGIGCALAAFTLLNRRKNPKAMILGAAIVWHAIAIALALKLPGIAYLFLVPAAIVSACAAAKLGEAWIAAAGASVAAVLMFPLGIVLYEALGGRRMASVALVIGLFSTLVAPLFPRWRYAAVAAVLAIISATVAMLQPAYTIERPKHVALGWVDDPAAGARWTASNVTGELQAIAPFERGGAGALPWQTREWSAPAPQLGIPRIALDAERTSHGVSVRLRSSRGADRLTLFVRGGTVRTVNGVVPPRPPLRYRSRLPRGWSMASVSGTDAMTVELTGSGPMQLIASDTTFGLPPQGRSLAEVRDASRATTVQDGDVTVTRMQMSL